MQPYSPYGPPLPPRPPRSGGGLWMVLVGLGVVVLLMVAGGVAIFSVARVRAARRTARLAAVATTAPAWSDLASPVPISSDDPMHGDRDALVTMVVFGDLQDPFTAKLDKTIADLEHVYGHDLRLVWKNYPLPYHSSAKRAAEAARCVFETAGSDAFFRFATKALDRPSLLDDASYQAWAAPEGVSGADLSRGLGSHRWTARIDADATLARSLHVSGTPTSFINGVHVTGAQPLSAFQTTIDAELSRARSLVASGVARDHVYVEASRTGFSSPSPTATAAKPPSPPTVYVAVAGSPARGPSDALVTIVEFSDLQCPYCRKAEATLDRLRASYGSDLRVVWKNYPLPMHVQAEPAAEVALEARAGKGEPAFWAVHDGIFDKGGLATGSASLTRADLLDVAAAHGVNTSAASAAIASRKYGHLIDGDTLLAKAAGVSGVPTFFINGQRLSGAQPYASFEAVVDKELARARRLVSGGTPRAQVYEAALADNTGLRVKVRAPGSGRLAVFGDQLGVQYTGKLIGGTRFDGSTSPFVFELGKGVVIKGWDFGLLGARKGESLTLTIPPDLGYGAAGRPGTVPPEATLIFDVEVVSID